jgi:very-short-patch-repair endonuclease
MVTEPPFEIDGQVFETVADLSRYSGIHYATLQYRLKKGLSVEEATKQSDFQKNRKKTTSKTYEFNGKTYRSIKSLSDETGVPYDTLRWRLKQGQVVETAVLTPVMEMVRESWEVLGVIYPSLSAAAKAYDKDPENIRQRVYGGLSIHDALFLPNQRNKPICVHGENYPSRAAVAKEFGISKHTFYSRLRGGLTPEEAVDRDIQGNVTMTVDEITYPSIAAAADDWNQPYKLVHKRKKLGWSDEDCLKLPSGVGTQFEFRGNVYPTLKDACAVTGIDPRNASYRLNAGWDIETALDPDTDVDNRKSITIDGVLYPTLSDAAREFDIVEVTFMKRIRSDWTPEQAAGIDPPPEFKRGSDPIPREEYIERLHLVHGDSLDFTHSDFNRAQDKVEVRCTVDDWHPTFSATPNNLLRGRGCPICKASHGEREISFWLEKHGIPFEREWTDHDIRGENPRSRLRFDFLIPDQKVFIEFDGQQHFEPVTFGGMSASEADEALERTQTNDRLKDEWALSNGHTMLRIRYDQDVSETLGEFFRSN